MWHTKNIKETAKELRTNIKTGLSEEDVKIRQEEFGKNKIEEGKKVSLLVKFLAQFKDFMIIILILAAGISALVSYFEGTGDYFDSVIIIAIVIFNGIIGLIQENRAEKSIEALKKMSAPIAKVRRNGKVFTVNGEDIVPGDIVILETGCYVPADIRLINTYNLKIEEASLTGETEAVEKDENILFENEKVALGDRINMAFASTAVVNGHAEGIVTNIGMGTEVGKIANMIIKNEAPTTPIQKKLEEVGKVLGIACIAICALIFLIGIIKKISAVEMFMTSVGLAVAAIPEGLPAIVTIILSIAVTKMAKRNAIIRKLPAVETLGSSKVICSDKTGTLTENNMKVVEIIGDKSKVLEYGALCCNCEVVEGKVAGEPTEVAIVKEAIKENKNKVLPRIYEIPFDSNRKLMTVVNELENGKYRIITKGAPEILLNICENYEENNNINKISDRFLSNIKSKNEKMAQNALRVLGVAYLDVDIMPKEITSDFIERGLTFIGLIGMIDPPRKGVKEAVLACRRAGIKTVMITGDHITTAKAIAKDLEILKGRELAITGEELDKIPDSKLEKEIMSYSVFARVTPEHKVRIVKAFQQTGAVVAMTGDGVNDAPALKKSNIGIAMGLKGTDVAKNAADMILNDDNFVTIVSAVKQGRNIFDNIKKAIHFLIATNIGEIVTIFVGLLLGVKSPLLAIQLLWVNLVTDSLPAIALGLEPPEKDIMNRPPRDAKKSIFADGLMGKIVSEGFMIGMFTILAFFIGNKYYGIEVARTMAFISLGMLELIHSFNVKSEESIFKVGILENKYLIGAFLLGTVLQLGIVFIPTLAELFKLTELNSIQWLITLGISVAPIVIIEIQKKFNELKFGKVVYDYKLKQEI
ncbi:MAG TPA: calcium-translocating P-type ATPase, PMCA-type [Clostridiaceae bacterium]|jgi:calcium-translocating P-type ATPase, PMCA-type|nr:calcium-translocating P-type ATPase, PMCA-type [Clostridium sp.]MEE0126832.1 calcium-translocating P-type ATPase, PMCA-type [Clostridia bacterium]HJJ11726.1 calcium-translocating P-type ATPase, PMCA-type [Clostridiaceae bacterium]